MKNTNKIQKAYFIIVKSALDLPRNVSKEQLLNALGEYSLDNLIVTKNLSLKKNMITT